MAKDTIQERVTILEAKDQRRDQHYANLNKKIDELTNSQRQIIELLVGTELNDKKGFIKLVDKIEEKVNRLEIQSTDHEKDLSHVKWWGSRIATALIVGLLGIVLKVFSK